MTYSSLPLWTRICLALIALAAGILAGGLVAKAIDSNRWQEQPRQLLYVSWPTELANGWEVQWEYNGLATSSLQATKEEALRLYAVLAGRMVEKE